MNAKNTASPGAVSMEVQKAAYAHCITVMRKDCGFPQTEYTHRLFSF